jgi:hypothetical protein
LRDDINRLQKEREMMAIQLEKTQSLLRLQVEIDRENLTGGISGADGHSAIQEEIAMMKT